MTNTAPSPLTFALSPAVEQPPRPGFGDPTRPKWADLSGGCSVDGTGSTVGRMPDIRSRSPISTEARGRLRRWKLDITRRYVAFDHLLHRDATAKIATNLSLCGKVGRQRSFQTLNRMFAPYANLQCVRLDRPAIAVWALLTPRVSVAASKRPDDPGATQNCVCVYYICAGQLIGEAVLAEGLWTLPVLSARR